jgi:hypothetical protein
MESSFLFLAKNRVSVITPQFPSGLRRISKAVLKDGGRGGGIVPHPSTGDVTGPRQGQRSLGSVAD